MKIARLFPDEGDGSTGDQSLQTEGAMEHQPPRQLQGITPIDGIAEEMGFDMDEIYQVLGRDILKSSLLDDIDLYLECDEDSLYVMPTVMSPTHSTELSPHKASSSTSTHFTDLMPDRPTSGMFNVDLDDNSDSLECVDLMPDKATGGLFNIEVDDSSDSPECMDLVPDKSTDGLFNVELDDNSDAHECVGLEPDKAPGRLFNIELDDNSDSQERLDLVPDKATSGLFNIELDDNSDSGECVDVMLDKPTGRLVTIELEDDGEPDPDVAFPVSTFVNCANVDDSTRRNDDLQSTPASFTDDDELSKQLQNTSQAALIECASPTGLPQQGSTAMLTEGSDSYCQAGRTGVLPSCLLESSCPAMNSVRGSSSHHSGNSSPTVHTTYSNSSDESQTQVVVFDQDTWDNAVTHGHSDGVKQVVSVVDNMDGTSETGDNESNTVKHLSKSKSLQQVDVTERTQNTEEANIPGKSTPQRDGPSTVNVSNNSAQEVPLITSTESELVTVTWSVPLNPVDDPVVEPPRYRCTQCKYTCTRENLLKDHRAKVHGEKDLFKCSRCNYIGQLFKHLQKHMSRQHNIQLSSSKPIEETQGEIPKTVKEVPKKERARSGNRTPRIHGPRPVQCRRQPIGTKIKILDENTKEKLLSMIAKYNWNLPINKWTGSVKLVSIMKPQSSAENKSSDETKESEKSKLFYCDQCDKTFKQKRSFEGHLNVHRGRFPFECADCDKSFSCKNSLRQHEKTHSTVRGHHCTEPGCRKSFRTKSRLKDHMLAVHSAEKQFSCERCGRSYGRERDLRAHLTSHTDRYTCPEPHCGKTFRDQFNLNQHYMTHTGEKPLQCEYCDYTCIQRQSLKSHVKHHHLLFP